MPLAPTPVPSAEVSSALGTGGGADGIKRMVTSQIPAAAGGRRYFGTRVKGWADGINWLLSAQILEAQMGLLGPVFRLLCAFCGFE